MPLSAVPTKDDFFNIKKASAADLMDAHRVPFQLMGGKPENIGSFSDIEKVAKVFVRNELTLLQDRFTDHQRTDSYHDRAVTTRSDVIFNITRQHWC